MHHEMISMNDLLMLKESLHNIQSSLFWTQAVLIGMVINNFLGICLVLKQMKKD